MSEFSWSKVAREGDSTMDSCYKLYSWINHTVLMLLFQILWKMSQISDYFKERSSQPSIEDRPTTIATLTKESKFRRHIRSMSDVQSSTPYRVPFRARINSHHTLTYDSDTRARRIRSYNMQLSYDSSDSSEYEMSRKQRVLEHNILKHTDSMRVL